MLLLLVYVCCALMVCRGVVSLLVGSVDHFPSILADIAMNVIFYCYYSVLLRSNHLGRVNPFVELDVSELYQNEDGGPVLR